MRYVFCCALLLVSTNVYAAGFVDGSKLLEMCASEMDASPSCVSYILGAADVLQMLEDANIAHNIVCIPPNASARQVRLVTRKFLLNHPERLNSPAAVLIADAMTESFPCKK